MTTGVILLNFGEPAETDRGTVVDYLERIFFANAPIEGDATEEEARERARELAERRAPGLIEEYEAIGGSPLAEQAEAQAEALEAELEDRGYDAAAAVGMQYAEPFIDDAVARVRDAGAERLVGLPVYPLCGPSTSVAALAEMADAVDETGWEVPVGEVTGWHKHPAYNRLRAENVASFAEEEGIGLGADDTALVFSAHGTPRHYIEGGSRYVEYVEEYCETQAALLGLDDYELGYQNHANRGVPWTEPEVEDLIVAVDAARVVVEPVSFMHEQSETLSELDDDLRGEAEAAGLGFARVPIPHDDGRFPGVLADLVEPFAAGVDPDYYNLEPCLCRDAPGAVCLNAGPNRRRESPDPATPE